MDFQQLADVAEKWCSNTPFELIATEETERRMDFYADPGVSFYVLCPDNGCGDNFGKNGSWFWISLGRSPHSLPAGTAQAIPKEMTPKTVSGPGRQKAVLLP
nr:maturin [Pan troglodytes]